MPVELVSNLVDSYLKNKEIIESIQKPTLPSQARSLFPVSYMLGKDEGRKTLDFRVYSGRPLAGVIKNGTTEYPNISFGKYEDRSVNIIKLGASETYTAEDQDIMERAMQNVSQRSFSNVNFIRSYLPSDPKKLIDSLDNSIEMIAFYGQAGLEAIKKNKEITISNEGKVFGLLNTPEIDNIDVEANGQGSTNEEKRLWENKTGEQIYKDVTSAVKYIRNVNNSIVAMLPDTMLASPDSVALMRDTYRNQYTGVTVYDQIKTNYKLNIIECEYLSKNHTNDV